MKNYLPLEANPVVIEKYMKALGGPQNIELIDVLGCDKMLLNEIPRPVVALFLLFPIKENKTESEELQKKERLGLDDISLKDVWFTKQTVNNACGTIAILHTVANIKNKAPYEKGSYFEKFFENVKDMNPDKRAEYLEKDEEIEKFHERAVFEGQSRVPDIVENIDIHFVTFVEVNNNLYELDGRKNCPINHGSTTLDTFLEDAVKVVQEVFMKNDPSEYRFSMIAVCLKS